MSEGVSFSQSNYISKFSRYILDTFPSISNGFSCGVGEGRGRGEKHEIYVAIFMTYFYRAGEGHAPPCPQIRLYYVFLSEMVREAAEEKGNIVNHHMIARYQTANKKSTQVWNFFLFCQLQNS